MSKGDDQIKQALTSRLKKLYVGCTEFEVVKFARDLRSPDQRCHLCNQRTTNNYTALIEYTTLDSKGYHYNTRLRPVCSDFEVCDFRQAVKSE